MKRFTLRHGLSYTSEYRAWQTMRQRCTNPENAAWAAYGGRGITVCPEWMNDPARFLADMGPKPTPAHELDRIDNDSGYRPDNCRWVLRSANDRNRRSTRLIEHDGETLALVAWSERTGIRADTIKMRLDAGWPVSEALTIPTRPKAPNNQAPDHRHPCADCGKQVWGKRCHRCENRARVAA